MQGAFLLRYIIYTFACHPVVLVTGLCNCTVSVTTIVTTTIQAVPCNSMSFPPDNCLL